MSDSDSHRGGRVLLATERPTGRRRSDRIVGSSAAIQVVVERAVGASASALPVHLAGPPGSGKGHLARAIHTWSSRAGGPFERVSCLGVDSGLIARELFGCAAAVHSQLPDAFEGALQRASNGTLLIDHVDALAPDLLEALGKSLGEGRFQRQGDATSISLRARVIASSREPLAPGPFRELMHHAIVLPPLRERTEDILPLAAHFLRLHAEEEGLEPVGFTAEARSALEAEPWPGNVRELSERVHQALRISGNGAVSAEALLLSSHSDELLSFKDAKRAFERRYVTGLLRRCKGNISRAARLAKKDRKDFYDVIRRTGIDPADFR